MDRILTFTSGPQTWQQWLAHPEKHWRTGYSARTLAHCWEASDGFPQEVSNALAQTNESTLANLQPLLAIPEFKVRLPGGERASQTDLFVLTKSQAGPVVVMVEGKVNESFGPKLGKWKEDSSHGKRERLNFLLRTLGAAVRPGDDISYQLLHRAVSAIMTAEQYHAVGAVILVHSFSEQRTGWPDYEAFLHLFGVKAVADAVQRLPGGSTVPLFGAWVTGDCSFLKS